MISEDYLRLALTMALRPFPEARRAEELHRIEGEIAGKMVAQAAKQPPPRPSLKTIDLEPAPEPAPAE
jgi:hypothetical protein